MDAFIKGISFALPKNTLSNDDLEKIFPEWEAKKISEKIGINNRNIAIEETVLDLSEQACLKLFNEYSVDKNSIDFIILCTQCPDYFLPTTACLLQERLGLTTQVGAFDVNLGCSGYVYGLSIAKAYIASGMAKNILLVTGDTYSKIIHPLDKSNRAIFGDAATATLISSEGFLKINDFVFGTDGKGKNDLILQTRAFKNLSCQNIEAIDEKSGNIKRSDFFYMDGTAVFNFTLESVPELVKGVLAQNKISFDQIDYFVFHQANAFMLDFIRKKIKIPKEKFCIQMSETGNTVSSTIPIAIKLDLDKILVSDKILLAGFGVGYSWAGCVIENIK